MLKRPAVKISLKKSDAKLELLGLVLLFSYWIIIYYIHVNSPDLIPSRLSTQGKVLGWRSKDILFDLPQVATIFYVLLTIISFFPNVYNYMTIITEDNAEYEYRKAVQTIRILKLVVLLVFYLMSVLFYAI